MLVINLESKWSVIIIFLIHNSDYFRDQLFVVYKLVSVVTNYFCL